MGRSSSKLGETPNNPLQEMQFQETQREKRKKRMAKEQKQIKKLQEKHLKKNKHKHKKNNSSDTYEEQHQKRNSSGDSSSPLGSFNYNNLKYELNTDEFNKQKESKIQQHLKGDLNAFLLNQIVLSQQFFKNYDRELSSITEELLLKENELNQNLDDHSILLSNPLDVAVAKWINFKPLHGPLKNELQPLQTSTMYVVFENIDISRPNDANYDSISPICKVDMDTEFHKTTPCKEDFADLLRITKWKGYVRLKLRDEPKLNLTVPAAESIYTDPSSCYSTTSSAYSFKTQSGLSSGYNSESDYDYAFICHLNSHHPLAELKMNNRKEKIQLDEKVLPESCVSTLGNLVDFGHEDDTDNDTENEDEESDEEDGYSSADANSPNDYRDYETLQAIKKYKEELEKRKKLLQQRFLNSKEFMRYFGELMRQKLAPLLGITQQELNEGTYRGASIYTSRYEIIPAIYVAQNAQSWPDCAFSFRLRERPISISPLTGQQFQWPTRAMIKRIETFGFHIIPIGFAPKRQRNPFRDIEWRIVFPKAERYLEKHLTNTQVKVFMLTKALIKTFVEPLEKNKALMFTMDQLRTHLFWECEKNFTGWPEEFLGEVFIKFIHSFMQRLREKSLRNYFIEDQNLFESIPEYSLVTLYSILADITANPLMHLMIAYRNLHHAEVFFPKLNVKKIYEVLIEKDLMKLKMQAKNSRTLIDLNETTEVIDLKDEGARGLVGMKQHREKTNGKLRTKTYLKKHNIEMKKKQELQLKRRSWDSIDVEFFFNQNMNSTSSSLRFFNEGVENLRRTNILEIILDHLLIMSSKCMEIRNLYMTKIYLSQAKRLCKCYHNFGCDMGAMEYLASIHNLDEELEVLCKTDDSYLNQLPTLPLRSSLESAKSHQECWERITQERDSIMSGNSSDHQRSVKFSIIKEREEQIQNMHKCGHKKLSFSQNLADTIDDNAVHSPSMGRGKLVSILRTDNKSLDSPTQSHKEFNISVMVHSNEADEDIYNEKSIYDEKRSQCSITSEKSDEIMPQLNDITKDEIIQIIVPKSEDLDKINKNLDAEKSNAENEPTGSAIKKSSSHSLLSKLGTSYANVVKQTALANSKVVQQISRSTEKLMENMQAKEKGQQLKEILQKTTSKTLKGMLNNT